MHHSKSSILNLQMSSKPDYAFGVHFTYDLEVSEKEKTFFDKLESLKKSFKIWSQGDLSICCW